MLSELDEDCTVRGICRISIINTAMSDENGAKITVNNDGDDDV